MHKMKKKKRERGEGQRNSEENLRRVSNEPINSYKPSYYLANEV